MNRRGFLGTIIAVLAWRKIPVKAEAAPAADVNWYHQDWPDNLRDIQFARGIIAPCDPNIYFLNKNAAWVIEPGKPARKL